MKSIFQTLLAAGLLIISASLQPTFSQGVSTSTQIDFGDVYENAPQTQTVVLSNPTDDTVNVTDIRFYQRFGRNAFSASTNQLSLAPGASDSFSVTFAPWHNVSYDSEMMLETDSKFGSVSVDLVGQGKYSIGYYLITENAEQEDLKQSLQTLLPFGHTQLGYSPARNLMFMSLDNKKVNGQNAPSNEIECVYTGATVVGYISRADAQNQGFNTEHTFPQSFFNSDEPMLSDLHHLFPVDGNANTQRSNKPFGVVSSASWSVGGSKSNSSTFEPRDEHKGRAARAMMYFYFRYGDYSNFFASQAGILRQWAETYPPDSIEIRRNEEIYQAQGNRNPFVDYPQFLDRIEELTSFSSAPISHALDYSNSTIDLDTLDWGPHTGTFREYDLVFVNHGNILEQITGFQAIGDGLSVESPGTPASVLPGRATVVKVKWAPTTNVDLNGSLRVYTSVSGMDSLDIPVSGILNYVEPPFVLENGSREAQAPVGSISCPDDQTCVFPIPAAGELNVFSDQLSGSTAEVWIYDLEGRKVFESNPEFKSGKATLPIENLSNGMYILKVKGGEVDFATRISIDQ